MGEQRWLAVNPAVAKTPPTPRQLHQPVLAHFLGGKSSTQVGCKVPRCLGNEILAIKLAYLEDSDFGFHFKIGLSGGSIKFS